MSNRHQFGGEFVIGGNYTAFMGDKVMLRIFVDLLRPSTNIANGLIAGTIETGAVFGYYFDAIDTWTRDLF